MQPSARNIGPPVRRGSFSGPGTGIKGCATGLRGRAERLYGINDELVRACEGALLYGRYREVDRLTDPLHASDLADLVEELYGEARSRLIDHLRRRLDPETLAHLDEVVREDVLDAMEPEEVAAAIVELDSDDAVDVIEDLTEEDQR